MSPTSCQTAPPRGANCNRNAALRQSVSVLATHLRGSDSLLPIGSCPLKRFAPSRLICRWTVLAWILEKKIELVNFIDRRTLIHGSLRQSERIDDQIDLDSFFKGVLARIARPFRKWLPRVAWSFDAHQGKRKSSLRRCGVSFFGGLVDANITRRRPSANRFAVSEQHRWLHRPPFLLSATASDVSPCLGSRSRRCQTSRPIGGKPCPSCVAWHALNAPRPAFRMGPCPQRRARAHALAGAHHASPLPAAPRSTDEGRIANPEDRCNCRIARTPARPQ